MKIVIISRNLPPVIGGMERLSAQLINILDRNNSCAVVGPRGASAFLPDNVSTMECYMSSIPSFYVSALFNSVKAAYKHHPDVIIATSGAVAPLAELSALFARCPYLVMVHGLDLVVKSKLYEYLFLPSLRRASKVIANSHNTARIAIDRRIHESKVTVVHPPVEAPVPTTCSLRSKYNLDARPLILFIGRIIPRKGLVEFITYSLPIIIKEKGDSIFVVAGSEPENALFHKSGVLQEVAAAIKRLGLENNYLYTGALSNEMLEAAYMEADVLVFPVKKTESDVEGFGMVALEAAIRGLPTVAFNIDGIPDAVSDGISGYLVEPEDYVSFASKTATVLRMDKKGDEMRASCRDFAGRFTLETYGEKVLSVIDD